MTNSSSNKTLIIFLIIVNYFRLIYKYKMSMHKPALMLYRRLLKTMMKTFDGDY